MESGPGKKQKCWKLFTFVCIVGIIVAVTICTVAFGGERKVPIYSVDGRDKMVAISFDCAWGDEFTKGILDILDTYDVKATFFMVNFWAEKYPQDVKLIDEKGHDIGNHSASHPDMAALSAAEIKTELCTTGDTVKGIIGKCPVLFRAPYGSYSDTLIECGEELGYQTIQWDVETCETAEKILCQSWSV